MSGGVRVRRPLQPETHFEAGGSRMVAGVQQPYGAVATICRPIKRINYCTIPWNRQTPLNDRPAELGLRPSASQPA